MYAEGERASGAGTLSTLSRSLNRSPLSTPPRRSYSSVGPALTRVGLPMRRLAVRETETAGPTFRKVACKRQGLHAEKENRPSVAAIKSTRPLPLGRSELALTEQIGDAMLHVRATRIWQAPAHKDQGEMREENKLACCPILVAPWVLGGGDRGRACRGPE